MWWWFIVRVEEVLGLRCVVVWFWFWRSFWIFILFFIVVVLFFFFFISYMVLGFNYMMFGLMFCILWDLGFVLMLCVFDLKFENFIFINFKRFCVFYVVGICFVFFFGLLFR